MTYLRSGIFLAPFHDLEENPILALERDMELLQHLDALNYTRPGSASTTRAGSRSSPAPRCSSPAAAERTKHIRLGTGVVSLPYHNPFIVADRMVQLDYQTRGRAMLGVGPGSLVHDAKKIGIDPADQRRMMNESLDVIIELLRGESVTRKTDWFDLREARLQLPPYTRPRMEMAVAAARSPAGALAAGRHGLGMLSIGGTSDDAMKHHASNWDLYASTAKENGHVPDRKNWRLVTLMHIAETREQARENVRCGTGPVLRLFPRCRDVPDRSGRDHRSLPVHDRQRHRLHRHAGRRDRVYRSVAEGLRRLRRDHGTGAELGGLGADQATLRTDGAVCSSALPVVARMAQGKLRSGPGPQ